MNGYDMSKMNNRIDFSKLTVEIQLRSKGGMIGQAAIEYDGLRITHFRFMKNTETGEIFVEMPSLRVWKKYQRMFWILSPEDHEKFEKLLLDKFSEYRRKVKEGKLQDNSPADEISDELF